MVVVALLAAAVGYLFIRVNRLEQMLDARRRPARTVKSGNPKVIPILKDEIEPGPFKKGARLREIKRDETDN